MLNLPHRNDFAGILRKMYVEADIKIVCRQNLIHNLPHRNEFAAIAIKIYAKADIEIVGLV